VFLVAGALGVGLLGAGLHGRAFPLGVPGEWTWERLPAGVGQSWFEWAIGLACVGLYGGLVALGEGAFGERSRRWSRGLWLAALGASAIVLQLALQWCAPAGYGPSKWAFALHAPGSNGYFAVARTDQLDDLPRFLRAYPEWVATQDALHVGTHPPGLFVAWRVVIDAMRAGPGLARAVDDSMPLPTKQALREIARFDPIPLSDRAALVAVGWLTLLCSALAVVPVYHLAWGAGASGVDAWRAAALWPVVPATLLFQPTADTAFPLLSAAALALATRGGRVSGVLAGLALALGMQFSLVFLAVGAVAGLMVLLHKERTWRARIVTIGVIGLGFAAGTGIAWATTGANPLVIWWHNQRNHARFYAEYPRSWLAWQGANLAEAVVALGIPAALAAGVAFGMRRPTRVAVATLAVLAMLQLSGRSLSEVGRLWIPLFPGLVVAAGRGLGLAGLGRWGVAATVGLTAVQVLVLEGAVQVVYALAGG
jgi:hypothetical protein